MTLYEFDFKTFNWTKVELKPSMVLPGDEIEVAFNWTKVELKQN